MSNHYRHFKHLHIPDGWEQYWSKYPNGYTLMEALINWVGQVNDMVEVSNEVSDQITCLQRNFNALDKELRASWSGYKESTTKQYEDFRDEVHTIINNWIATIEPTIQNKVVQSLQLWLADGTLADIINNDVFDMKANQSDFQTHTEEFDSFKAQTTTDLTNLGSQLQTDINTMAETKKNKGVGLIYANDYKQLSNETDDHFINRLLASLPNEEGTLVLDGKDYNLTDTISLKKYQTLKGAGHSTNLILNNGEKEIIKIFNDEEDEFAYGVGIEDLVLRGNNLNTGIHLVKSTHVNIRNIYIYETKWGIWGDTVWLANYERITIRNYNSHGLIGFFVGGGTSNTFTNVWVKNFGQGYDTASIYTVFNGCACDTFTKFAYYTRQNTTLNSCGAESADLTAGGFVFGAGARGATYNNCETMNIRYTGEAGGANIFYFQSTKANVTNYRNSGSYSNNSLNVFGLDGGTDLTASGTYIAGYNQLYNFINRSSIVLNKSMNKLSFVRWNAETVIAEV